MSFWMVLVATLLIGGVFCYSAMTAARDADKWVEEYLEDWANKEGTAQ